MNIPDNITPVPIADIELHLGKVGVTDWLNVSQDRVDTFAEATGDHQFIHVDPQKATPIFGGTIAHGFLTLSLMPMLSSQLEPFILEGYKMTLNYGGDKLRFLKPVLVGSNIRARSELMSVTQKSATNFLVKSLITIEIEGEKVPAMIFESLAMQVVSG